ncbi:MAG TPA: hypothetical protein VLE47_03435 [Candidatus Saccharimonadales bacterium]|nr:hypothetical protein [Candidatus Saccharimonadales bacterium]
MRVNTFEAAMLAFIGLLVAVLVTYQRVDHSSSGPDTEGDLQGAIIRSLNDPSHGDYSSQLVVYATGRLQTIYSQAAGVGSSANADGMLEYLTYLAEGSVQSPAEIDYCTRVLPLLTASHDNGLQKVWDSNAEMDLVGRIDRVATKKGDHRECNPTKAPAHPV